MEGFKLETEAELIARLGAENFEIFPKDAFVPRRLLIQWHITEKCNLRCKHCYQNEGQKDELSFEKNLEILDQIIHLLKKWKIRGHLNLTGGEPWIKDWFPAFLDKVGEHQDVCSFAVLSNGTLLTESHVKQLRKLRCRHVQVSIDGMEKTHDEIRGKGNFAKAVEGLKLLRKYRILPVISFTSHKQNHQDFIEVAELGRKLGVKLVWSDRMLPFGRGEQLSDQMMQPYEVECFFEKMYEIHKKFRRKWFNRTKVKLDRALQFLALLKHREKNVRPYKCEAGRTFFTILPAGEVLPCRRMPIVVGNLLETNIEDIYRNSALLRRLRSPKQISEGCENCEFASSCNGGLRCLSYAYYGDPFKADPQCFVIHRELPHSEK